MLTSINSNKHASTISEGVVIEGKIHFSGPVKIDGTVIGEIISEEKLIIGRSGNVESNIKTKNVVISGRLKGDVEASGLVEITSTGNFTGNLIQENAMLKIEKGGVFSGNSILSGKEVISLDNFNNIDNEFVEIATAR